MLQSVLTHLFAAGGGMSLFYLIASFWKTSPLRAVAKAKLHDQLETLAHGAVDKLIDDVLGPPAPPAGK